MTKKRRIFARYRIPTVNEIEKDLEKRAKFFGLSISEFIDRIIRGAIGDIVKSTEIIIRENQRVNKAKRTIDVYLSVLNKNTSKKVSNILSLLYKDEIEYNVAEIENKHKLD